MLKAVELPAGVTNLATSLANVDGDAFTLEQKIWNAIMVMEWKEQLNIIKHQLRLFEKVNAL